jgi:hypothetical protein
MIDIEPIFALIVISKGVGKDRRIRGFKDRGKIE